MVVISKYDAGDGAGMLVVVISLEQVMLCNYFLLLRKIS
jgi:hypothetical protein